jgi:hypothetical protein
VKDDIVTSERRKRKKEKEEKRSENGWKAFY